VKEGLRTMESRMKSIDQILNEEREKTVRAQCELEIANSNYRTLEEMLIKKENELNEIKENYVQLSEENIELRTGIDQIKAELKVKMEEALSNIQRADGQVRTLEDKSSELERLMLFYRDKSEKYEQIGKLQELNLSV
jgi:chromosome segregation ATPase